MPSYPEDQIAIHRGLSQKVLAELLEGDLDRAFTKVNKAELAGAEYRDRAAKSLAKELGALLGNIRNLSERIDDIDVRTDIHVRANALQSALGPHFEVKRPRPVIALYNYSKTSG